ncbi:MAG: glycosyltransferase family 4 protein [Candidatus Omnitrophica bacterium]|nr:glycosyltransferase family 4 protein [Candidatus Omnitrophota bacterium]
MNKKILIAESGSGYGGSAKYLAALVPLLKARQFDIEIVAYGDGPFIQRIEKDGCLAHHQPAWKFKFEAQSSAAETNPEAQGFHARHSAADIALWCVKNLRGVLDSGFRIFQCALSLTRLTPAITLWLWRRRIRLVHLNNEILTHIPLLVAARFARCKVLCHLHGWRDLTRIERRFAGWVHQFIAISEEGARFFSERLNGRVVIPVPNGLPLEGRFLGLDEKRVIERVRHGIRDDEIVVSLIGRILPWKGHEVFLPALLQARKKNPRLTGCIVGHDPSDDQAFLKKLKRMCFEYGIEDQIKFLPWQEDIEPVYALSDIIVHASTKPEPFGLVILEAMAARKPVIATRAGGVLDMIKDSVNGLLVEPGNISDLADAILRLAGEPDIAERMARAGEATVREKFTMERNAAKIGSIYLDMLGMKEDS